MCKHLPKLHLHTESHQDRFRNKKVFSCVPLLLWKSAWSNGVCKMSHFEAGSRNFTARKLIFGYFVVQSILSKSYYRHFSIRPFICMRDGLKDEESVPPCCGLLYSDLISKIKWLDFEAILHHKMRGAQNKPWIVSVAPWLHVLTARHVLANFFLHTTNPLHYTKCIVVPFNKAMMTFFLSW